MIMQDVIVVGAGLAGLVCARRLQQAGQQVSLLEKSRGLGGRLATRRINGVPLDHGTRYLAHHGDRFRLLTQHWLDQGLLAPWQPRTYVLNATGDLHERCPTAPYLVAPAGMNAIGKTLGRGLTIHRQQRLVSLALTDQDTWQLTAERAEDQSLVQHQARAIVLALPAPQILPILQPLAAIAALSPLLAALATVTYAPVVTVMAQYDEPIVRPTDALPGSPTAAWMVEGHPDTPLFWVGLDSSKRAIKGMNVVIHSSAAFARHWLEMLDLPLVGEALLAQASQCIAGWVAAPQQWQVHRWRYGLVETPSPASLLTTTAPLPLVACGDWCGAANLDTALASGWAAAKAIQTALGAEPLPPFPAGLLTPASTIDAAS